jgi:signal transduction histidine kinase
MRLSNWLTRCAARVRRPRRTVRLRLTLLYGGLFIVCGAGLLTITYVLVSSSTHGAYTQNDPSGRSNGMSLGSPHPSSSRAAPQDQQTTTVTGDGTGSTHEDLTAAQQEAQVRLLVSQADRTRATQLHQLLIQSGIALAIMSVISIGLGWIIAGRILRRLSTITTTARDISATNLHERLALDGPGDELKELGDTFDELLGRLEASFQAQRRFIANASHELRTPLARQRTVAQVALSDPDATVESLRIAHERVLAAGAQQERLIAALLTLARGQAGIDRREPFDLARLAGQVIAARRDEAELRTLRVRWTLSPAPATGDPRLVEQLVVNLVDNALRHNVPRGSIEVTTGVRDGHSVLSVSNTGPVIPVTEVDRLLQPFQRLGSERTGHRGNLGLGLSIVQAIASAHGATINATPRPEGGLLFTVEFPPPETSGEDGRGSATQNGRIVEEAPEGPASHPGHARTRA